jgi:curved DNA-binding protein CbpA
MNNQYRQSKHEDYYAVLGVSSQASVSVISKAYRSAALLVHPDKNPDPLSIEKFHMLQEAYLVLSNPSLRSIYDDKRRLENEKRDRDAQMDVKRRSMKENLLQREQAAASFKRDELGAKQREFESALAELRRQQQKKSYQRFSITETMETRDAWIDSNDSSTDRYNRAIYIQRMDSLQQITLESVSGFWSRFGPVEQVYLLSKLSAVVVYADPESIKKALASTSTVIWKQVYEIVSPINSNNELVSYMNQAINTSEGQRKVYTTRRGFSHFSYAKIPFDEYEAQTLDRLLSVDTSMPRKVK